MPRAPKLTPPVKGHVGAKGKREKAEKPKAAAKAPKKPRSGSKAKAAHMQVATTNAAMRAESGGNDIGRGRPTSYSADAAEEILRRMHNGETLREICRDDHLPSESAVRLWNMDDRDGFSARYATARSALVDYWADDIMIIGDDGRNDWMERRDANGELVGVIQNGECVQRSRLRVETRKWLLSKLRPDVYGDKAVVNHDVSASFASLLSDIYGQTAPLVG